MPGGNSQQQTTSVDPQTRSLGLLGYQNAQNAASQPFQNFDPNSIAQYMSPYIDSVVNAGTRDLNQQRNTVLQQNAGQQTAQNAFGGNRGAVMDAMTNKDFTNQIASFDANTRNAGFSQAENVAMQNWQAKEMYPMLWQGLLNGAFGSMVDGTGTHTTNTTQQPNWWQIGSGLAGDAAMAMLIP